MTRDIFQNNAIRSEKGTRKETVSVTLSLIVYHLMNSDLINMRGENTPFEDNNHESL
jgi:hypothetical protein